VKNRIKMLKVGLTGNFWSGHNQVAEIFEEKGIHVFDADLVLKFILLYSNTHIEKIKSKFGNNIYEKGLLDLKYFDNNSKFDSLLEIVQLDLIKAYEKWRMHKWDYPYTVFKSSILFEREMDRHMNYNINVCRPAPMRKFDLIHGTQMSKHTIDFIVDNEMDETMKSSKSTYTINMGGMESSFHEKSENLKSQVFNIDRALKNKEVGNYRDYNRGESYKNMLM
jgi:dephospho-CoA kinase